MGPDMRHPPKLAHRVDQKRGELPLILCLLTDYENSRRYPVQLSGDASITSCRCRT